MVGWMDGWMDEQIDRQIDRQIDEMIIFDGSKSSNLFEILSLAQ